MTTSHLIQILCKMDPNTEIFVSLDGFPYKHKEKLERVYSDDGDNVVLTTSKMNYKKKK